MNVGIKSTGCGKSTADPYRPHTACAGHPFECGQPMCCQTRFTVSRTVEQHGADGADRRTERYGHRLTLRRPRVSDPGNARQPWKAEYRCRKLRERQRKPCRPGVTSAMYTTEWPRRDKYPSVHGAMIRPTIRPATSGRPMCVVAEHRTPRPGMDARHASNQQQCSCQT